MSYIEEKHCGLQNKHLVILTFALLPVLLGCSTFNRIEASDVSSVRFAYITKGTLFPVCLEKWEDVVTKSDINDTVITDESFIRTYTDLINNLKPKKQKERIDLRVVSKVKMKDGKSVFVCFGEDMGILYGKYNMEDSPSMFELLDSVLYGRAFWKQKYSEAFLNAGLDEFLKTKESDELFDRLYNLHIIQEENNTSLFYQEILDKMLFGCSCYSQKVQETLYEETDSVDVNDRLLTVLDSMINNNNYKQSLIESDKASYDDCKFFLFEYGIDDWNARDTLLVSFESFRDSLPLNTKLYGYFNYLGHDFYLIEEFPHNVFVPIKKVMRSVDRGMCEEFSDCFCPHAVFRCSYDLKGNKLIGMEDRSMPDVFEVVEENPRFPGENDGMAAFVDSISVTLSGNYKGESAVVKFVVEKEGSLTNSQVLSINGKSDESLWINIIQKMPKWIPGKHKGKEKRVWVVRKLCLN